MLSHVFAVFGALKYSRDSSLIHDGPIASHASPIMRAFGRFREHCLWQLNRVDGPRQLLTVYRELVCRPDQRSLRSVAFNTVSLHHEENYLLAKRYGLEANSLREKNENSELYEAVALEKHGRLGAI